MVSAFRSLMPFHVIFRTLNTNKFIKCKPTSVTNLFVVGKYSTGTLSWRKHEMVVLLLCKHFQWITSTTHAWIWLYLASSTCILGHHLPRIGKSGWLHLAVPKLVWSLKLNQQVIAMYFILTEYPWLELSHKFPIITRTPR